MDMSLVREAWAQLGAVGLLLVFMVWQLRQKDALIESERSRNQVLTDKVIAIADASARTAAELTAAVQGKHP